MRKHPRACPITVGPQKPFHVALVIQFVRCKGMVVGVDPSDHKHVSVLQQSCRVPRARGCHAARNRESSISRVKQFRASQGCRLRAWTAPDWDDMDSAGHKDLAPGKQRSCVTRAGGGHVSSC